MLSQVARRVVVAHPGHLRRIVRSKQKNDRVDTEKLAKLLFLGELPTVYVPPQIIRAWRQVVEYRRCLIAKRTRTKNALRAVLRTIGKRITKESGLRTQRGMAWFGQVELPDLTALQRDLLLEELAMLDPQVKRDEKELQHYSHDNPAVALLRTIPGVGIRTAEAVVAYLDDPLRFTKSKQVGSCFGLVPWQDQSSSTNRLGHVTRSDPSVVRHLLSEAAWRSIRCSPTVERYHERIQQGNTERKKITLVARAHYLARVTHAMLRDNQPREKQMAA